MSWIETLINWYVGNAEIIFKVSVVLFMVASLFNAHMTYKRLNNLQNWAVFLLEYSRKLELDMQKIKEITRRNSESFGNGTEHESKKEGGHA